MYANLLWSVCENVWFLWWSDKYAHFNNYFYVLTELLFTLYRLLIRSSGVEESFFNIFTINITITSWINDFNKKIISKSMKMYSGTNKTYWYMICFKICKEFLVLKSYWIFVMDSCLEQICSKTIFLPIYSNSYLHIRYICINYSFPSIVNDIHIIFLRVNWIYKRKKFK